MKKISIIAISHFLNSSIPNLILFFLFLLNYKILATQIGLLIASIIFIFQTFSANQRSLILLNKKKIISNVLIFRFFLTLLLCLVVYFFNYKSFFYLSIVFFCGFLWLNEIYLTRYEISKKNNYIIYDIFILIFYIFFIFYLIFSNFFITFSILNFLLGILTTVFFFKKNYKLFRLKNNKIKKNIKDIIIQNIYRLSFYSSVSIVMSSVIWRYYIVKMTGEEIAGLFFIIFAFFSFPGTFLNNYIGVSILKEKKINFFIICFFLYILLIIVLIIISFYNKNSISVYLDIEFEKISKIFLYSFIGSIIMMISIIFRLNFMINFKNSISMLFKTDIFYGITISFIIPLMYFFSLNDYLYYAYFYSSIITFLFYSFIFVIK